MSKTDTGTSIGRSAGIDLGTSNSVIAVLTSGGTAEVIPNAEGDRITPSYVAYRKSGAILVGKSARMQALVNPENTFYSVKRFIGCKPEDIPDRDLERLSYKVISVEGALRLDCPILKKVFAAEQISSQVLRKLVHDASENLGEKIKSVVITVPAYFRDSQRQATKDAGRIAGLEVLRIVNEPTAACLSWGLAKADEEETVLIFDLGGGTLDVSIMETGEGVFEVRSTAGDTRLGGDDFDNLIVDWAVEKFIKDKDIDLREEPIAMQRLCSAAEKVKVSLSALSETVIDLPFLLKREGIPIHMRLSITREEFEVLCKNLLTRCKAPMESALEDADLSLSEINQVLMVGGSTRIPSVLSMVKDFSGKVPGQSMNPDEAVALGAALQAGVLCGEVKDVVLIDVLPLSVGIKVDRDSMATLIKRNTVIPVSASDMFTTFEDGQPQVGIAVFQGERKRASANKMLATFTLAGIEPAPRGMPQITVSFDVNADGILSVTAKDGLTGREQGIEVSDASTLSSKEVDEMLADAKANLSKDRGDITTERGKRIAKLLFADISASSDLSPGKTQKKEILQDLEVALRNADVPRIYTIITKKRDLSWWG